MGGGILSRPQIPKNFRLRRAEKHCFQCFWSSLVVTDGAHWVVHRHTRQEGDREVVNQPNSNQMFNSVESRLRNTERDVGDTVSNQHPEPLPAREKPARGDFHVVRSASWVVP